MTEKPIPALIRRRDNTNTQTQYIRKWQNITAGLTRQDGGRSGEGGGIEDTLQLPLALTQSDLTVNG